MKNKELTVTQLIRLVDVFFIGPIMIKASTSRELTKGEKQFLAISGIGTIIFNGYNYITNLK
jgi:hypothetical protein